MRGKTDMAIKGSRFAKTISQNLEDFIEADDTNRMATPL
jgi:hypothetical protein